LVAVKQGIKVSRSVCTIKTELVAGISLILKYFDELSFKKTKQRSQVLSFNLFHLTMTVVSATIISRKPTKDTLTTDIGNQMFFEPDGEAGSLYFDTTPICNYLNRGIGDQEKNKRDSYVISPKQVKRLSDIKHLAFGIDIPETDCHAQSRSIPCHDKDDPNEWCLQRVELSVGGIKLFDKNGGADCLLKTHGGTKDYGINTIA
jgi:hypothetical protein